MVRLGLCRDEHVQHCLTVLEARRAKGEDVRLGQVLVEEGFISPYQLDVVLGRQAKALLHCPKCAKLFNVAFLPKGWHVHCATCQHVLVDPPRSQQLGPVEDVLFEPVDGENVDGLLALGVKTGRFTAEEFQEALRAQATRTPTRRVLDLLVEWDDLDAADAAELRDEVEERERTRAEHRRARKSLFGQIAMEAGWLTQEKVFEALRVMTEIRAQGKTARLGDILVQTGALTRRQVVEILVRQTIRIGRCTGCDRQYNLVHYDGDDVFCPECNTPLTIPEEPVNLAVADDLVVGSPEAPEDGEIQLTSAPDEFLGRTRRMLTEFRTRESLLEHSAGEGERAPRVFERPEAPIGIRTFFAACALFMVAGAAAGGYAVFQLKSARDAEAAGRRQQDEVVERLVDDPAVVEERAAADRAARVFEVIARLAGFFASSANPGELATTVGDVYPSAVQIDPTSPFRGDLEMMQARARLFVLYSAEYERLDRRRKREWIDAAAAALSAARDAYAAPGARTAITARLVIAPGAPPVDASLRLAAWAPERRLRGRESTAWYDARTGIVDYREDPNLAVQDMESLSRVVQDLARKLGD